MALGTFTTGSKMTCGTSTTKKLFCCESSAFFVVEVPFFSLWKFRFGNSVVEVPRALFIGKCIANKFGIERFLACWGLFKKSMML